jgi:hypothetical protein
LLRERRIQPTTSEQEELMHFHIRRQCAVANGVRVQQPRITSKETRIQRIEKAAFKLTPSPERLERQGCEDAQPNAGIRCGASVELVGDMVRLAKAKRQAEHDMFPDLVQNAVGKGSNIGMIAGQEGVPGSEILGSPILTPSRT